ncbi:agmatine deiminase, partial [Stenotrophomonas maltophilia]
MSNRRHFLTQLAGAAGLGGLAALGLAGLPGRVAAAGQGAGTWRMPDEHDPQ